MPVDHYQKLHKCINSKSLKGRRHWHELSDMFMVSLATKGNERHTKTNSAHLKVPMKSASCVTGIARPMAFHWINAVGQPLVRV